MRRASLLSVLALVWLLTSAAGMVADDIRVVPVVAEGRVSTSFTAPTAFDDDAQAVARSGLLLTLTYSVDLRRPATVWFDRTLASTVAAVTIKFDTLTSVYQVSKQIDGTVVWSDRTADEAQLRTWLQSFDHVGLDPLEKLEPNAEYYVRVRLHTTPRRAFVLWPWGSDDGSGRAVFTFIR